MIIYTFTKEGETFAYPSLRKAKSERAALFNRKDRPAIIKVTLPYRLTRADACSLLMRRSYALFMEDVV